MAVGARVRPNGLGVGILLGALAWWGCGVADDDLAAVLAGFGRTDVPIIVADVPRDQGEQIPDVGQDPGGDPGQDHGVDLGEDPGLDPGIDAGQDPGHDPGVDLGQDLGVDPGTDPGQDPGIDPGWDPGQDPGVPVCPAAKDCTGRACGPDPVCGMSCGTCVAWATCNTSGMCIDEGGCGANCGAMVTVPAGSFMQGCNEAVDTQCEPAEKPYHQVTVAAYEIDKYEVTVGEYGNCVSASVCTASTGTSSYCNQGKSGKGDHPMNCITWYQAREYCAWAGKRLCSESEWEKASRGTDGRKYPWGNETATCEYAVMNEGGYGCGTGSTWPVGSKLEGASPYGALDLSGNVWEWVEDDWHSTYTGAPPNGSAWVDEPRASVRVLRGGSFGYGYAYYLRSSLRDDVVPAVAGYDFGARCCRSK